MNMTSVNLNDHTNQQHTRGEEENYDMDYFLSTFDSMSSAEDQGTFICGGMQQFINRKSQSSGSYPMNTATKTKSNDIDDPLTTDRVCNCEKDMQPTIEDIPDSITLLIFSYLPSSTLCHISSVCYTWYILAGDHLLWNSKLNFDMRSWNHVGNTTNPLMYRNAGCHPKDIYLRCSPEVNAALKEKTHHFRQLSTVLRSLWPRKTPKFAMFGPGLESSTGYIVRCLIQDRVEPFGITGMFPGQFDGVGTGFNMTVHNTHFDFSTLYTTTRAEREKRRQEDRVRYSRLLNANQQQVDDVDGDNTFEVRQAVKDFAGIVDGLIFVVDATKTLYEISCARSELYTLVKECKLTIPVLIVSCTPAGVNTKHSCIDIIQQLRLEQLGKPWQVHQCIVDNLQGLPDAIHWIIGQAHRK